MYHCTSFSLPGDVGRFDQQQIVELSLLGSSQGLQIDVMAWVKGQSVIVSNTQTLGTDCLQCSLFHRDVNRSWSYAALSEEPIKKNTLKRKV